LVGFLLRSFNFSLIKKAYNNTLVHLIWVVKSVFREFNKKIYSSGFFSVSGGSCYWLGAT
jgi:hypothetical protein